MSFSKETLGSSCATLQDGVQYLEMEFSEQQLEKEIEDWMHSPYTYCATKDRYRRCSLFDPYDYTNGLSRTGGSCNSQSYILKQLLSIARSCKRKSTRQSWMKQLLLSNPEFSIYASHIVTPQIIVTTALEASDEASAFAVETQPVLSLVARTARPQGSKTVDVTLEFCVLEGHMTHTQASPEELAAMVGQKALIVVFTMTWHMTWNYLDNHIVFEPGSDLKTKNIC